MEASLNSPNGLITLTTNTFIIGRSADNHFVIQDPQASSHHAEIRPDAQGYVLTDLGSTNGTFVNEQRLSPRVPRLLVSNDVIRIGSTRLTYEIAGSDDVTVRAGAHEYPDPGYTPNAAPTQPWPSSSDYNPATQPGYQQSPASSNYPAQPGYPGYQQPRPPSAYSNYNADTAHGYPDYQQPQQPTYPGAQPAQSGYPPQQPSWAGAAPAPVPGQFDAPGVPGSQAVPPVSAAQPSQKKRIGLIIAVVILLLLVIGGGIGAYLYLNRSTPVQTLDTYCSSLQSGDYQSAYNQLSSSLQGSFTESQFANAESDKNSKTSSCTHTSPMVSSISATATLMLGYGTVASESASVTLLQESGTWKISQGVGISTPTKTLTAYCNAIKNNDAQGAFNQLSSSAQSKTSVAQFTQALQQLSSPQVGGIKSCTVSNVQQNGSTATAQVQLVVGNKAVPPISPSRVTLIKENGIWKVDKSQ